MSALELFTARLAGRKVGTDEMGNTYYESRKVVPVYNRTRRFAVYARGLDSSSVPAEWHAWLHHMTDAPVPRPNYPWLKPHHVNLTGTPQAYRPKGHDYVGGRRQATGGDYEAWTPGS